MKITLLCENTIGYEAAEICQAEWGFSAFIQVNDVNILFDTGHSDLYLKNAKQLKINLEETDYIVLSHHHWDHTGGLRFHNFKDKKKLIAHPDLFEKLPMNKAEKIRNEFEIISSKKPLEFSKNIFFLGEVPRRNQFEPGSYKNDKMLDDSAIVIKDTKGAVVISGCSHSGICNICQRAKEVSGQRLYAVIGGFHLFENCQEIIEKTIGYFKIEKVEHLFPMHCMDFPTQVKLYMQLGIKKYSTGDVLEI